MMAKISQRRWRGAISFALAYVLAAQGLLFALGVVGSITTAKDAAANGFQLCSHSVSGNSQPGGPAETPVDHGCCSLCIAASVYLDCTPALVPSNGEFAFGELAWPRFTPRRAAVFANLRAWPRAPPRAE
jgi:hypothetical protein